MRSAVVGAKNHFKETGELRPAFYSRREYLSDGSFTDNPMVLEPPANLSINPRDMREWEAWLDDVMEKGRDFYSSCRENLLIDSLIRIDGTHEEQAASEAMALRFYRIGDEYQAYVAALFRETLVETQNRDLAWCPDIPAPP